MSRGQTWTREEFDRALELLGRGLSYKAVAAVLGRTDTQLYDKLAYENKSLAQREQGRLALNARRRAEAIERPPQEPREPVRAIRYEKTPPEVVSDRAYRQSLPPRDLTAEFCGDPLPGYSALERRA